MDEACPHCGQNAPLTYPGLKPHCSACGKPRPRPIPTAMVSMAGKPQAVVSIVAGVAGWIALAIGGFLAIVVGFLLNAIFPASSAGLAIGGAIGALTLLVSGLLMVTGRKLHASGTEASRSAKIKALLELAERRNGIIHPQEAAGVLRADVGEIDALLTELATKDHEHVSMEFDDAGTIYYQVKRSGAAGALAESSPSEEARLEAMRARRPSAGTKSTS